MMFTSSKTSLAVAACLLHLGTISLVLGQIQKSNYNPCGTRSGTASHETFCDKYYECTSGNITRLRDCPNGLAFISGGGRGGRGGNQLFSNCDYDFNVDCFSRPERIFATVAVFSVSGQKKGTEQINPCDVKGKIVGDLTYCDRYWECVNGQPELYDCPNGLAFAGRNRGVADGCDYPWRGNYCEGRQLANPPIGTEHCDWLYGIFGHETSCTRYWTCWNGTATEQLCIGGLLYNEDTHACDWPEAVKGCQKHPLCKDDANGNVALGKSCNRYWQCQGGYPRLQRCPAMLVFDKKSLRCVVPPTEDCDIPTTTPSPEEEDQNENGPPQQLQQRRHQQQQTRTVQVAQLREREDQQQIRQDQQQQRQDQQQQRQNQQQKRQDQQQVRQNQQQQRQDQQQDQQQQQRQQQQQQRSDASRPQPVYVVREANNAEATSSEEDFTGGNRQL